MQDLAPKAPPTSAGNGVRPLDLGTRLATRTRELKLSQTTLWTGSWRRASAANGSSILAARLVYGRPRQSLLVRRQSSDKLFGDPLKQSGQHCGSLSIVTNTEEQRDPIHLQALKTYLRRQQWSSC